MALVAYDASSSENESDSEENSNSKIILNPVSKEKNGIDSNMIVTSSDRIFEALPKPKGQNSEIIEEDDEFLRKKAVPEKKPRPKVKIGVPSLSQYESDEDEPKQKKTKPQDKGSGLFALLPPPKVTQVTTKSFVPNSVAKKTQKPLVPQKVKKQVKKIEKKPEPDTDDSDLDDIEVPETFNDEMWMKVCGQKTATRKRIVEEVKPAAVSVPEQIEIAPEAVQPYSGLDNECFKKLVGKMRKKEEIEVVEINEDDILPDKDTWMLKALTDPSQEPKFVVNDPVNDTCKRKHHITYLAQQAKANEQELQSQWATSRFNRKQTQSKYGF